MWRVRQGRLVLLIDWFPADCCWRSFSYWAGALRGSSWLCPSKNRLKSIGTPYKLKPCMRDRVTRVNFISLRQNPIVVRRASYYSLLWGTMVKIMYHETTCYGSINSRDVSVQLRLTAFFAYFAFNSSKDCLRDLQSTININIITQWDGL